MPEKRAGPCFRTGSAGSSRVHGELCLSWEGKAGVFEAANIREWRGHDVVDDQGHKIGELEAVYVDTSTDLPSFGTVTVGLPTRHRLVFVPLDQATVGPGYLKVIYDKKQVKDSPSIET